MTVELTGARIFIGAPGGLEEESRATRRQLSEHSRMTSYLGSDLVSRPVMFIPVTWEADRVGNERRQDLIANEIRSCDYAIFLLHDRWEATASNATTVSGTHAEYSLALACMGEEHTLMRNVLVLFKGVEEARLRDPGPELSRVLAFKEELEQQRAVPFATFDTTSDLQDLLERHLYSWMREIESGLRTTPAVTPASGPAPPAARLASQPSPIGSLVERGLMTRAEREARARVRGGSDQHVETLLLVLRANGRHEKLVQEATKFLEARRDSADPGLLARVCILAGQAMRRRGKLDASLGLLDDAERFARVVPSAGSTALSSALEHRGLTLTRLGRLREAMQQLNSSMEIDRANGRDDRVGITMTHLALTHRDHNELQQAEELLRSASGVLEASGVPHHRSLALSSLGLVLVDRGRTSEARELFERAVAINEEAGDAYGLAIATGHRARVHLATRDLDLAQSDAQRCLVYNEVFNSKEGMAIGTLLLGQVALARGDTDGTASSYLLQSVTISTDIRHQFFSLVAKCDLACAYLAEGHELMASNLYRQCVDLATTTQVRLAARYVESKQLSFPSRKYYQ